MSVLDGWGQARNLLPGAAAALAPSRASIDQHIGARVRGRRQSLGLTQRRLGEVIGARFQQIHRYETGANRISAACLWSLAEALDVEVDYFFEGLAPTTEAAGGGRHKSRRRP